MVIIHDQTETVKIKIYDPMNEQETTIKLEIGQVYDVFSNRKGNFRIKLTYQDDTWATGIIVKGRAKAILAYNEVEEGEEVTLRKSLTSFTKR